MKLRHSVPLIIVIFTILASTAFAQTASISLRWTAPGDDGSVGTATRYEMRYSTTQPDTSTSQSFDSWWAGGTIVTTLPIPTLAGTTQTCVVTRTGGFLALQTYYFVIRAVDDANNFGAYSNVAWRYIATDAIPPARIQDLR